MSMTIAALLADYRSGQRTPAQMISEWLSRGAADVYANAWIHRADAASLLRRLQALEEQARSAPDLGRLPLFGVPFAVKDNIDVAGMPTTAACPAFSYVPKRAARVVEKLEAAGAIVLGKTNLDQFATGLVGTRSPYGPVSNSFRPEYISGGSSSGSAVVVARGEAAFALGTDTAGSGRVRVVSGEGHAIEVEVWSLPASAFGSFVAGIPSPLGIGRIELEDGESVQGFVCESWALTEAQEVSQFGGWRAYIASLKAP